MSPQTYRKVKAFMMIIMLGVAERHRIQANINLRVTLQSGGAAHAMAPPPSKEQGKLVAKQLKERDMGPNFQEQVVEQRNEDPKRRQQLKAVMDVPSLQEQVTKVMSDPNFQEQVNLVSHMVEALASDPTLQQQARILAEQIEGMKDGLNNLENATHVFERVEAVMADPSMQAQARLIAEQMAAAEHMVAMMEQPRSSGQPKRVLEQMEAMKAPPLALVEVSKSSGQESAISMLLPQTAGALNFEPLSRASAFPVGRPELDPARDLVSLRSRPALASGRPTLKFRRPVTVALENERGLGPWMSMTGMPEHIPSQGISRAGHVTKIRRSVLTSARGLKTLMPSLMRTLSSRNPGPMMSHASGKRRIPDYAPALLCFSLWFISGFYHNINNKLTFKATDGSFPMIVATLELGVAFVYAVVLWLSPDRRQRPNMSFKDYVRTLPIGLAFAGQQIAQMFALCLGAVSFGQIVRNAEPAVAAVIGTCLYGAKISAARWFTLIPVIGGVMMASIGEVDFAMGALVTAALANVFNSIRGNEIHKLMTEPRMSERLGTARNVYAIMSINSFLLTLPLMLFTEGKLLGQFLTRTTKDPALVKILAAAGAQFIVANEFSVQAIQRMGTVQNAVARTAAGVVTIVGSALVLRESLGFVKLLGSGVSIGGVLLYFLIDNIVQDRKQKVDLPPPLGQTGDTALSSGKPKERGVHALLRKLRPKRHGLAE